MPKWLLSLRYVSSSSVICLAVILSTVGLASANLTLADAGATPGGVSAVGAPNTATRPGSSLRTLMGGLANSRGLNQQLLGEDNILATSGVATAPNFTIAPATQTIQPRPACGAARPYIYIATTGVCMNIITVGLDVDGRIEVPDNTYQAGWYNGSNWFGTGGTSFLDGHSPGQFSSIKSVDYGTVITIGLPDGRDIGYKVTGTEIIGMDNPTYMMEQALYTPGLNLMTCHGPNDNQRFVVYSTPI